MRFGELTQGTLREKIEPLLVGNGIQCIKDFMHPYFTSFYALKEKQTSLMSVYQFHPDHRHVDRFIHQLMRTNQSKREHAKSKLVSHGMYLSGYLNHHASIKLHINLNNIIKLDEEVILGLIGLLCSEMMQSKNDIHFSFKIINPAFAIDERFKNTDQFTLYFDSYSSLEGFFRLTKLIQDYLNQQKIPENTIKNGPNDNWVLNPFVSSRFNTNKLHIRDGVFPFFDIELAQFFNDETNKKSKNVPLYLFELVFNVIVCDETITNLTGALNEQDSIKVQEELKLAVSDPQKYIVYALEKVAPEFKANKESAKRHLGLCLDKLKWLIFDLNTLCNEDQLIKYANTLDSLRESFIQEQRNFHYFDLDTYESFNLTFIEKKLALAKAIELCKERKNKNNPNTFFNQKIDNEHKEDLNSPHVRAHNT